jgi:uncharacterized integral membrane protein
MILKFWKVLKAIILILFIVLFVSFAVANRGFVQLSLFPLPLEIKIRVFLLIIFSVVCGIIISLFVNSLHSIKAFFKNLKKKQKVGNLEKEIEKLKKEKEELKNY